MPNVGATTLGTMRGQAQQRADMVNSSFLTTSEWNSMVNAACQQLWEKLVEAYGDNYELASGSPYSITTDGITDKYALPTDFFKLLGVDLQLSATGNAATGWISLRRFNFADRNKWTLPNIQTLWGRSNMRYNLYGNNLWLAPLPAASQTVRIHYIPRFTPLVNDADSFDAINGWEEWVVLRCAIIALSKEESDASQFEQQLAIQEDRLRTIVENRDAGSPATVVDVYRNNGTGGWGGWSDGTDWGP